MQGAGARAGARQLHSRRGKHDSAGDRKTDSVSRDGRKQCAARGACGGAPGVSAAADGTPIGRRRVGAAPRRPARAPDSDDAAYTSSSRSLRIMPHGLARPRPRHPRQGNHQGPTSAPLSARVACPRSPCAPRAPPAESACESAWRDARGRACRRPRSPAESAPLATRPRIVGSCTLPGPLPALAAPSGHRAECSVRIPGRFQSSTSQHRCAV